MVESNDCDSVLSYKPHENCHFVSSTQNVETISTKTKIEMWQNNGIDEELQREHSLGSANISDSALSLKNFSSISHASGNHTIYKGCSPPDTAKNVVRSTSTPMHYNGMKYSPESIICMHSVSSTSCQVSSIHSSNSSESDSSPTDGADVRYTIFSLHFFFIFCVYLTC